MHHLAIAFGMLCCFFVPTALASVDQATAERVLAKSGTLSQIDALPAQFKANFEEGLREQRELPLTREEFNRRAGAVDRVFAVSKLRASIVGDVAKALTGGQVTALELWYESPVGKRMLELEAAAAKSDQVAALREGGAALRMLPAERVALLRSLLEATQASDFVAELSIDMSVGATHAALMATSRTPPPPINALREGAAKERAQIVKSLAESLLAAYAQTYESASDAELKTYAAFMASASGKAFSGAVISAFSAALISGATELGKVLVEPNKTPKK